MPLWAYLHYCLSTYGARMARLTIPHNTVNCLALSQAIELGGELSGCIWVCVTAVVTYLVILVSGAWIWGLLGLLVALVGSMVAHANAPAPGYVTYCFDREEGDLTVDQRDGQGRSLRHETYALSQLGPACLEDREYFPTSLSTSACHEQILTLPVSGQYLTLATVNQEMSEADLQALAEAINAFLKAP